MKCRRGHVLNGKQRTSSGKAAVQRREPRRRAEKSLERACCRGSSGSGSPTRTVHAKIDRGGHNRRGPQGDGRRASVACRHRGVPARSIPASRSRRLAPAVAAARLSPNGSLAATSADRHGGGPYSWFAEIATPAAGTWHATLSLNHASAGCAKITREIVVNAQKPASPGTPAGHIWQVRNSWNSTTESLFSAW